MKRVVCEQRLDDLLRGQRLAGTFRNLKFNPSVEDNFVDPFIRKGSPELQEESQMWVNFPRLADGRLTEGLHRRTLIVGRVAAVLAPHKWKGAHRRAIRK